MLVRGDWSLFPDGITRPVVRGEGQMPSGGWEKLTLLLDAGADRTVLDARFLSLLSPLALPAAESPALAGVGGRTGCVFVRTRIRFLSDDRKYIDVNGPFGIFTDPASSDISVLGRDVTNNFDVIYSYSKGEFVLLASPHCYQISRSFE